jgi:YidC/Oxa1 family membrane protein insertase
MDLKRTLVTVLVIAGIWIVWMQFFAPKPPAKVQQPTPAPTAVAPTAPSAAAPSPSAPVPSPATGAPTAAGQGAAEPRPAEEKVELSSSRWRAVVTTYGGALASFELLDPQLRHKLDGRDRGLELVPPQVGHPAFQTAFEGTGLVIPADAVWRVERRAVDEVVLVWEGGGVRVTKRFKAEGGEHVLTLTVDVANGSDKAVAEVLQVRSAGWHDSSQKSGFGRPAPNVWTPACLVDGKAKKNSLEGLKEKGPMELSGDVRWAAVQDRYFILAAAVAPDAKGRARTCRADVLDANAGTFQVTLRMPEEKIEPQQSGTQVFTLFGGPKVVKELDAVTVAAVPPGGTSAQRVDAKLGEALDYGWWSPISRVMLVILVGVHRVINSWGIAIIALTILVKILTYPLTQKSMKSGKAMAALKPKMEAIQKRYKDDKQRMNMEVMNLYKTHGVNPLGGCLPMLIQLPIWWGLYATLGNAVELYRSKFLWMPDLTQPDPYFITPVAMGAFMFLQQRITPMPTDSQQQKMMMYMMPLLFTFMSLWFPAGLTVYILTNTLLTMVQQWLLNRSGGQKVLKPARAS